MSEFEFPGYNQVECTDEPKTGEVVLNEFIVKWDYNGNGGITVSLNNSDDELIQSLEHTKSKL